MATLRGEGSSLGEALLGAFRGAWSRRRPAKSWQAMLRQLTKTARGQGYLGRYTNSRRWVGWLSEEHTPTPESQSAIARAYREFLGAGEVRGGRAEIYGLVAIGEDVRNRGYPPHSPFRVNHRNGRWERFDDAWVAGGTPAELETHYIWDVIMEDVDGLSQPPEFPGSSYVIIVHT